MAQAEAALARRRHRSRSPKAICRSGARISASWSATIRPTSWHRRSRWYCRSNPKAKRPKPRSATTRTWSPPNSPMPPTRMRWMWPSPACCRSSACRLPASTSRTRCPGLPNHRRRGARRAERAALSGRCGIFRHPLARARQQQSFAAILDAQRTAYEQATQAWVGLVSPAPRSSAPMPRSRPTPSPWTGPSARNWSAPAPRWTC